MSDFEEYVRKQLGILGLPENREAEIVAEISEHLREAFLDALDEGLDEREALACAESPFVPWDSLRRHIQQVERSDQRWPEAASGTGCGHRGKAGIRVGQLLADLRQDLRFALRTLRRRRMFGITAVVTLAVGIGSTALMFSVVDGVLIRDLPYQDPNKLVSVWKAWPSWQGQEGRDPFWDHLQLTWAEYQDLKDHASTLVDVAAFMHIDQPLMGVGEPEPISVGRASANLFDLLGIRPFLGRAFGEEEEPPLAGEEGGQVVILSHELWSTRFGQDRNVLGRTITLGQNSYQVIGVLPPGLRISSDMIRVFENGGEVDGGLRDAWIPLRSHGDNYNSYELLARLAPEASVDQARAEVQTFLAAGPEDQVARVQTRKGFLTDGYGAPLLLLLVAAGLLLLVACVNVAGLLVGEAGNRAREVAVRHALGASRMRLIRQFLAENLLLGVAGSALGVLIASGAMETLLHMAPPLPRSEEVTLGGRVFFFAACAGIATGLLFGLAPALSSVGRRFGSSFNSRGETGGRNGPSIQAGIVSVQVALTVVLLVAGGLVGRSLWRLLNVDPGFDAKGVVTWSVSFPEGPSEGGEDPLEDPGPPWDLLLSGVREVGNVDAVSGATDVPFDRNDRRLTFHFERGGESVTATFSVRYVLPGFHEVMGIPLRSGRFLTAADRPGAPHTAVVSEGLAERFWPGESPMGSSVMYGGAHPVSIVGVVGDVRDKALSSAPVPTVYLSALQYPQHDLSLVARTRIDPGQMMQSLRPAIRSVASSVLIGEPTKLTTLQGETEADDRFRAILLLTFAALATLLVAVGIFGVTARSVAVRTREMGIRTALGANSGALVAQVVGGSLTQAAVGTGLGLAGAFFATRCIQPFLFGLPGTDPTTYSAVSGLILLVALGAAYLPASRVSKIAPMEILKEE